MIISIMQKNQLKLKEITFNLHIISHLPRKNTLKIYKTIITTINHHIRPRLLNIPPPRKFITIFLTISRLKI